MWIYDRYIGTFNQCCLKESRQTRQEIINVMISLQKKKKNWSGLRVCDNLFTYCFKDLFVYAVNYVNRVFCTGFVKIISLHRMCEMSVILLFNVFIYIWNHVDNMCSVMIFMNYNKVAVNYIITGICFSFLVIDL